MAKSKFPKKTNEVKETVPNTPSPALDAKTNGSVDVNVASNSGTVAASTTTPAETAKTEMKSAARKPSIGKPEIVKTDIAKTDGRANLVPINLEEEIRRFAYLLAERRGFEPGHEAEDWLTAEHEIRQRYHQQSA
ncbi:MAG TPA: DUF2934 domain-containing protein [Candidatus Sulfotelmatobacter sp.]